VYVQNNLCTIADAEDSNQWTQVKYYRYNCTNVDAEDSNQWVKLVKKIMI
jgi:hypothetical protein